MDYKKKYEELLTEHNQYVKESIKWSVEDFTTLEMEGWEISDEKAQEALEHMIRKHDCNYGITWADIENHIEDYGTEVKPGKERWRGGISNT